MVVVGVVFFVVGVGVGGVGVVLERPKRWKKIFSGQRTHAY